MAARIRELLQGSACLIRSYYGSADLQDRSLGAAGEVWPAVSYDRGRSLVLWRCDVDRELGMAYLSRSCLPGTVTTLTDTH